MKLCIAGEGAIAGKHLDALARIPEVEVVALAGGNRDDTRALAESRKLPFWTTDLGDALARSEVEAVILATPTPLHAAQAEQALRAGKPVLIEIPMADSLADAERLVEAQRKSGLPAMVCHTRRFNPGHQWIRRRIAAGELKLQHLVVEIYFLRRQNINALGRPRRWSDHLLWHHACHTVDLFQYQTGGEATSAWAQQGPVDAAMGIALDMSVALKAADGALCTLSLSFNNDGPIGTWFRYICDRGTYIAHYDGLVDGHQRPVDLSDIGTDGIELQDREFIAALRQGREPAASVAQCLPAMRTLDRLERCLLDGGAQALYPKVTGSS